MPAPTNKRSGPKTAAKRGDNKAPPVSADVAREAAHAHGSEHGSEHDHAACIEASITRAEQAFEARGLRLTTLRRLVLEEIANSHKAIGAYDLLERLQRKTGKRMAPISVYRALDALLEIELVHRIESRNAFVACHKVHSNRTDPDERHVFMVCEWCDLVVEVDGAPIIAAANAAARAVGFEPTSTVIETTGTCAECAKGTRSMRYNRAG